MDITFSAVISSSSISAKANSFWTTLGKDGSFLCFCVRNLPEMSKNDVRQLILATLELELSKAKRKGVIENLPTVTIVTLHKGFRFKMMGLLSKSVNKSVSVCQGGVPASTILKKRGFGIVDYDKIFRD